MGALSLTRVAAISNGDRGAAVTSPVENPGLKPVHLKCVNEKILTKKALFSPFLNMSNAMSCFSHPVLF